MIWIFHNNMNFSQRYESDGDSKFIGSNGSKNQVIKQEFWFGKKLGYKLRGVWNVEQGYSFETQKFANKRMTCKTSNVFSGNGSAKRSMHEGSTETS
jgi:hypothetical protein